MNLLTRRALVGALAGAALLVTAMPHAAAQTVDELKKKGSINIGLLVDFPPYGTVDASNNPDGYDADVARLLGKDWGSRSTWCR